MASADGMKPGVPIAIVGAGCRFPGGANSLESFHQLLLDGVDAIRDVPSDRWSTAAHASASPGMPGKTYSRWGGFIEGIDRFEPEAFGISAREAAVMDPQQRLLLELVWEAHADAGIPLSDVAKSRTGVFVGISTLDYSQLQSAPASKRSLQSFTALGTSLSIAANRLSYCLDARGPSFIVDTACSSSLVALDRAVRSLQSGECDQAIVCGVNALLSPEVFISFSAASMLSPDGRCKAFDASANGFVRAEGGGALVLRRLADAQSREDRVHALILGSGVNQDGRTTGLAMPNGESQARLMREIYSALEIDTSQVAYLEAHGTGTAIGDPTEAHSIGEVFGKRRDHRRPLVMGSVKTNIGHLEAGSGMAGVLKAVLSLKNRLIYRNLHFREPNPRIAFDELNLRVPVETQAWPDDGRAAVTGVNSFGFGGTNAHVVLAENGAAAPLPSGNGHIRRSKGAVSANVKRSKATSSYVLPLTARNESALTELAGSFAEYLSHDDVDPAAVCRTAAKRRTLYSHRLCLSGNSTDELIERLNAFLEGERAAGSGVGQVRPGNRPLVMIFGGQGPQHAGMGLELMRRYPVFRDVVLRCDALIAEHLGWSILSEIQRSPETSRIDETQFAQPGLFVVQAALAALWQSWGITPSCVVGHSVGEVAAAWAAGAMDLESACRVIAYRSSTMQEARSGGAMIACALTADEAKERIQKYNGQIFLGAVNGPRQVTLSGEAAAVDALTRELDRDDVWHRALRVSHAFHSSAMDTAEGPLRRGLAGLASQEPQIRMLSTVTAEEVAAGELDADYWWRNVRDSVEFEPVMRLLMQEAEPIFLEIGPHPVLSSGIAECARVARVSVDVLASQRRGSNAEQTMRGALCGLFCLGVAPEWDRVLPAGDWCWDLPQHPWHRDRFWHENPDVAATRIPQDFHPLLGFRRTSGVGTWEQTIGLKAFPWLNDHQVKGSAIVPGAAYVELMLAALSQSGGPSTEDESKHRTFALSLKNVQFQRALFLAGDAAPNLQVTLSEEDHSISIHSRAGTAEGTPWVRNAVAEWSSSSTVGGWDDDLEAARQRCDHRQSIEELYEELREQGLEYGPAFQGVRELCKRHREAVGRIQIDEAHIDDVSAWWCHPTVLDGCFQIFASLVPREYRQALKLPVRADHVRLWDKTEGDVWCHVVIHRVSEWSVEGDIAVFRPDGRLVAEIEGFRCQAASWVLGKSTEQSGPKTYRTRWHEVPLDASYEPAGDEYSDQTAVQTPSSWLVFADSQGVADSLIERLEGRGCRVVAVHPGSSFGGNADEGYRICPGDPSQITELVDRLAAEQEQETEIDLGVLHCWSMNVAEPRRAAEEFERDTALSVDSIVALAQALGAKSHLTPRIFGIITRGARRTASETEACRPSAMGAVGLGRVLANEFPAWTTKLIDLAADSGAAVLDQVTDELLALDPEEEIAWRDGRRWVPRLESGPDLETMELSVDDVDAYRLEAARPGSVDNLGWVPWKRTSPAKGEVEIAVDHAAINFRDVLKCLGLYPADRPEELMLGDECAGVISAVGPGVEGFAVGDRVVSCVPGCFRSHVNAPAEMLLPVLPDWETHDAATIPIAFLTAWYSLRTLGHLAPDETVLIHAAAGGVGLAAVQIAQMVGARVFATAGSEEKRLMLREMGCELVMDSRSLAFADQIRKHTKGHGVDVVLNSLAGEALVRSVDSLAPYGRFLEIGKRDLFSNSKLGLWPLRLNGSFHAIDLGAVLQEKPVLGKQLLGELRESLESGQLRPLPHTQWQASQVADAFRLMSQGKHAGKQVVDLRDRRLSITTTDVPQVTFESEGTYVVSGGLGGFGYATAKWIVERGGKHVALISRRSSSSPEAEAAVDELRRLGAEPVAISCDVSDSLQVTEAFRQLRKTHPPVRGIFHAAMVIDDAPIAHLTPARIAAVLRPKALGAWNLHDVSRDCPLDHFVLFGSVSASIGNRGQANYAAANALLEGLAEYRHAIGLPATTVGWGFVSEVGFAADKKELMKLAVRNGFHASTTKQYLEVLERLLPRRCDTVVAGEFDWEAVAQSFYRNRHPHGLMTALVEDYVGQRGRSVDTSRLREEMETMAGEERIELLGGYLQSQVARILGLAAAKVDADRPIVELGLDSLMGIELATVIEQDLATALPNLSVSRELTVSKLTRDLLGQLGYATGADAAAHRSTPSDRAVCECLIPLRNGTETPGLICFHPVGGAIDGYYTLADVLDESLSVYAMQSRLLFDQDEYASLEAMVAAYTDRLRSEFADGPYRLFGFSLGGYLAASIAQQLESEGATVEFVGIADCPDYVSSTAEDSLEQFTRLLIGAYEELSIGIPALRTLQESDRADFRKLAERLSKHHDNGHDQVITWLTKHGYIVGELPERTIRKHVSRMTQHLKLVRDCRTMPVVRAPVYVWRANRGIGALSDAWRRTDDLPVRQFELDAEHSTILNPPSVEEIAHQINSLFALKAAATE